MVDCIFCRIAAGEIPAKIVHSDEQVVVFEDSKPQAPLHVLVIPRQHLATARDLEDGALLAAILGAAHRVAAERGMADTGYRLVFNVGPDAGQTDYHAHLHVLGGRGLGWPPG